MRCEDRALRLTPHTWQLADFKPASPSLEDRPVHPNPWWECLLGGLLRSGCRELTERQPGQSWQGKQRTCEAAILSAALTYEGTCPPANLVQASEVVNT